MNVHEYVAARLQKSAGEALRGEVPLVVLAAGLGVEGILAKYLLEGGHSGSSGQDTITAHIVLVPLYVSAAAMGNLARAVGDQATVHVIVDGMTVKERTKIYKQMTEIRFGCDNPNASGRAKKRSRYPCCMHQLIIMNVRTFVADALHRRIPLSTPYLIRHVTFLIRELDVPISYNGARMTVSLTQLLYTVLPMAFSTEILVDAQHRRSSSCYQNDSLQLLILSDSPRTAVTLLASPSVKSAVVCRQLHIDTIFLFPSYHHEIQAMLKRNGAQGKAIFFIKEGRVPLLTAKGSQLFQLLLSILQQLIDELHNEGRTQALHSGLAEPALASNDLFSSLSLGSSTVSWRDRRYASYRGIAVHAIRCEDIVTAHQTGLMHSLLRLLQESVKGELMLAGPRGAAAADAAGFIPRITLRTVQIIDSLLDVRYLLHVCQYAPAGLFLLRLDDLLKQYAQRVLDGLMDGGAPSSGADNCHRALPALWTLCPLYTEVVRIAQERVYQVETHVLPAPAAANYPPKQGGLHRPRATLLTPDTPERPMISVAVTPVLTEVQPRLQILYRTMKDWVTAAGQNTKGTQAPAMLLVARDMATMMQLQRLIKQMHGAKVPLKKARPGGRDWIKGMSRPLSRCPELEGLVRDDFSMYLHSHSHLMEHTATPRRQDDGGDADSADADAASIEDDEGDPPMPTPGTQTCLGELSTQAALDWDSLLGSALFRRQPCCSDKKAVSVTQASGVSAWERATVITDAAVNMRQATSEYLLKLYNEATISMAERPSPAEATMPPKQPLPHVLDAPRGKPGKTTRTTQPEVGDDAKNETSRDDSDESHGLFIRDLTQCLFTSEPKHNDDLGEEDLHVIGDKTVSLSVTLHSHWQHHYLFCVERQSDVVILDGQDDDDKELVCWIQLTMESSITTGPLRDWIIQQQTAGHGHSTLCCFEPTGCLMRTIEVTASLASDAALKKNNIDNNNDTYNSIMIDDDNEETGVNQDHRFPIILFKTELPGETKDASDLVAQDAKFEFEAFRSMMLFKSSFDDIKDGSHSVPRLSRLEVVQELRGELGTRGRPRFSVEADDQGPVAQLSMLLFDEREFRAALPYELYRAGLALCPLTLPEADYVVSRRCAVERKAHSDLVQSLQSGRLGQQLARLEQTYQYPIVLIEDSYVESIIGGDDTHSRVFCLSLGLKERHAVMIYRRLVRLMMTHTNASWFWTRSPTHSASQLLKLKRPDYVDGGEMLCGTLGIDNIDISSLESTDTETNRTRTTDRQQQALKLFSRLPGVTSCNAVPLMQHCGTLAGLVSMSQSELRSAMEAGGDEDAEKNAEKLYHFLHGSFVF